MHFISFGKVSVGESWVSWKKSCEFWEGGEGGEGKIPRFYHFEKSTKELSCMTLCARPVHASVTMMTGQENGRNSSCRNQI